MAVISYTRMTAAPPVNAAVPAGLARVSQGLLREASKLHVAQGWGPALYADGESTQLVAWGASNVWRTFAAFLQEVDPAQTWYATIRCIVAGDVAVRGGRSGDGQVISAAGLYTIPLTPIPMGAGLALFELQLLSKRVAGTDDAETLTWSTLHLAVLSSVNVVQEWVEDATDLSFVHHTLGDDIAYFWPARGDASNGAYTTHTLSAISVDGIAIHATSDGQPYADTLGLTPTLRNAEHDHRREAAELVRTRPRQICAMGRPIVSDSTHTNARRWTQRIILDGTEQSIADAMLVDEQSSYRVHAVMIHNGTAPLPLRVRVYVDGNEVASTVYNLPPLAADSFLRWSLNLPMVVSGSFPISETDAWYEPTESLPRVTVQTQLVSSPGALSITVEQVGGNATRLGIVAMTVVPVRPPQSVAWLPFASRIGSILDFLRAPNRPFNEVRREVANWERLDADTTDVAATVWRASPVAGITLTCDAVLTDTILTVDIIDDDGVTVLDTLTLDATGTTAQLSATSIALTGGESYYIGVSTAEVTAGAVASVRLYETQGVDPSMALSVEYASRSALLADATQDTGATGYAPSYAAPTMVRQWDGADWIVVNEIWDGVTSGQTVADLAMQGGVENAIIYFSDTDRAYQYDGAVWTWLATPADGSLDYPYQATGADYAAVQTALAALGAGDGEFAIAYITGGPEYLLEYVAADTAWYAPDGGDGSQLSPYWTATASGSGALASLQVGAAGDYAVIAKGTGSPVTVRSLAITSTGDGYASTVWVPAAVYALGAPSTADVAARYPDPADYTITPNSGTIAANSGAVSITNGASGISIIQTTASRGAAATLGLFFTGFAVAGVTATSTQSLVRVNTSSDSGQYLMLEWGGSGSPSGQTTKLNAYNGSGTRVDTGILLSSLTYWCAVLNISTNVLTIYSDGASVYSATCVITSADSYRGKAQTQSAITGSRLTFGYLAFATWT